MGIISRCIAVNLVALFLLVLAGCAISKPSRFYLLTAESSVEAANAQGDLALGIGPIEFPKYLDRPQIVTRTDGNRLCLAEFDRWAEPLEQNFTRVLGENLSALLATENIILYPWKRSAEVEYQIVVHVNRFDAAMGEGVVLQTRWTVLDAAGHVLISTRASNINEPLTTVDYTSIVRSASHAVVQLSRQIASELSEMRTHQNTRGVAP